MTKKSSVYLAYVIIVLLATVAFGILLHHFLICGRWYDVSDFLHHEVFLVLVLGTIAGILIMFPLIWGRRK